MADDNQNLIPASTRAIVTSQAPQSRLSSGDIEQPFQSLASGMQSVAKASMDAAEPLAQSAAAEDLSNQKVTLNADGSANVENPVTAPLIFGDAGETYHKAVLAGTIAQYDNVLSQKYNEMHTDHPTDPGAFKSASDAFLQKFSEGAPPILKQAVLQQGAQLQTQHLDAITDKSASISVENQKTSIKAQIDDQKNTLIALARQGGTNTPEFQQGIAKMNASYDALASNPLFKMPQDQIDLEKKNTASLMQGEALVSQVDATFKKRDGKFQAQEQLKTDILGNPNLREVDRTRLYAQGMARLAYLSGDAKATVDANRAITTEMEKNLADGNIKPTDPVLGMAIQRAYSIGDDESAKRLTAAAAVAQHFSALNPLPNGVRNEALGLTGGAVNQAVPPEGRALLDRIAQTESAGRYNVRYGGRGDITFQGYGDHPRVAEPITSGPDVGKTSTAAGRYQFIAPTWDMERQKLGLTDFSPANQDAAAWDLAQTEYRNRTGKDLLTTLKSGQTSDVLPNLSGQWSSLPGGRQPAGRVVASSVSGGPGFTAEDVQRNPFLISAYVRSLAADPELRVQSAKQTATAVGKGIDNGFLPAASSVAEVNQAAAMYPDKLGTVADEMNGRLDGQKIAQLPPDQRAQVEAQYRAATAGPDVHQTNLAAAALAQVDRQETNMREHPLIEAASRGWTQPPAPIDASHPETIAPALVQRASASARIGSLNQSPNPPLLDKDDVPKLQSALQGQAGAQVLGQIGQSLKPDEMKMLLDQEGFRSAVTGMSRSGDPAKMNAAYSFMDTQQRQNPLAFDRQFPDGLKDLRSWQSNLAFYPPDEAAKRLMRQYDPAQSAAMKASGEVATAALKNISAASVVSKFSTGFGPFGAGARTPVSTDAGIASGALKADYDANYKAGFVATGDATMADKFAMEKLANKYAVSPVNGNRVTANAPERYYPEVGGSHDWMSDQLDADIKAATGGGPREAFTGMRTSPSQGPRYLPVTSESLIGMRQYAAARAIVPDATTESDIASGKPPSYQIILQDGNGRWGALQDSAGQPRRIRFDPTQAFAAHATAAEQQRAADSPDNAGKVQP